MKENKNKTGRKEQIEKEKYEKPQITKYSRKRRLTTISGAKGSIEL